MINDDYYLHFENEFRGSRIEIKRRVSIYLPIIEPLKTIYPDGVVVDLGCGRGEWIEVLKENGWRVQGIDSNKSMIELCQSLGLPAVQTDASDFLRSLTENSVSVISGIHIAEHLPFEMLLEMVKEAYRALLPGGMLILETPNPENNIIRAINFYIDPSHRNPLPPELMQFITKDSGFSKSIILRLNGPKEPEKREPISRYVIWALTANPDYGIVAQKRPDPARAGNFHAFNSADTVQVDGLTILNNSMILFENDLEIVRNELGKRTNELGETLKAKEADHQQLEAALNAREADRQQMVAALNAMEAERQQLEAALNAKETDRQQMVTALNTMEAEHQKSEAELKARDVDRQQLGAALKAGEVKRLQLEAALKAREADRQQLEAARNAINTELEVVKKNRDQVLGELGRVYRSRSFRITTPLRIIFGSLRKWRGQLKRGKDRSTPVGSNSPQNKKSGVRQVVDGLRKVAWIAILLDKFKERFPREWYGTARQIKKRFPLQPESITPYQPVALDQITLENDKHFLDLFQRELSRRQAKRTETKS